MKKNANLVEPVHTDKVDVARTFVEQESREVYSSMFGINTTDGTALVSHKAPKNNIVVELLTIHATKTVSTGPKKKSEIDEFYNTAKGDVDVADVKSLKTTVQSLPHARRCPVVIFCNILNMFVFNAYTSLHRALFPSD